MNTPQERLRRSMTFIPGHLPEHIATALDDPYLDSALFDLEDLVIPSEKDKARKYVAEVIQSGKLQEKDIEIVVRINHPSTPFFDDDMAAVMPAKPDMIRIPKVESRDDVLLVEEVIAGYEQKLGLKPGSVLLMSAIESPKGLLGAYEIAASSPRMIGMALSAADYTKDMRMERTKEGFELDWARGMILNCARAAGVFVMDTTFLFQDLAAFEAEAVRARRMGFDGKTSISAEQNKILARIFSPTPEEIALAKKALALEAEYQKSGVGFAHDGDMFFDKPIVDRYRRILRIAEKLKQNP